MTFLRKTFLFSVLSGFAACAFFLFMPPKAHAATITWNTTSGTWDTPGNWDSGTIPTSEDDVIIPSGTVTASTGTTIDFSSLVVGDGSSITTLRLYGDLGTAGNMTVKHNATVQQYNANTQALTGNLTVESGGNMTHQANSSSQEYVLQFSAQNIDIQSGATVNVNQKGYAGASSGSSNHGKGPGRGGRQHTGNGGGGGGHGGAGDSAGGGGGAGGSAYCDITNVNTIGSGGGGGSYSGGGDGGGLIYFIAADTITINGSLTANGQGTSSLTQRGGAGAGGGIRLIATTIAGTPTALNAQRGSGRQDGGGGCVQIEHASTSSIALADIEVNNGLKSVDFTGTRHNNFPTEQGTTNVSALDRTNVSNYRLANQKGFVQWSNPVNVRGADFDSHARIGDGFASFDIANLHSSLDTEAQVQLDIGTCTNVTLYYASAFYESLSDIKENGQVCNEGTNPACSNISCEDGIVTFTIPHFDSVGGEGAATVPEFSHVIMAIVMGVGSIIVLTLFTTPRRATTHTVA